MEQPVKDSERQLLGIVVDEDTRDALVRADMSPEQLRLIDAILTLPGKSLELELQRRTTAINAVTLYCGVEEGHRLAMFGVVVSSRAAVPRFKSLSQMSHSTRRYHLSRPIGDLKYVFAV